MVTSARAVSWSSIPASSISNKSPRHSKASEDGTESSRVQRPSLSQEKPYWRASHAAECGRMKETTENCQFGLEFEGLMIVSNGRRHQEVFNGSVLSEFCSERFRSSAVALSEESGPLRAASLRPPPKRGCWCKPQPGQLSEGYATF